MQYKSAMTTTVTNNMSNITEENLQWIKQAEFAISQGQTIADFILHVSPANRNSAFKAYKKAQRKR